MSRSKFAVLVGIALIIIALFSVGDYKVGAQTEVLDKKPLQTTALKEKRDATVERMMKNKQLQADRKTAATQFRAASQDTLLAEAAMATMTMDPGGIPHYFGPYPNWANSPLPQGAIASITIDDGGSGYVSPTVTIMDVYGTGSAATASANVAAGSITSITVTNGGGGYSAPIVKIEDTVGVNAMATAVMGGPFLSGIRKFVDSLPGVDSAGANNLGQYIPKAIPDKITYPGCDYYVIELGQYSEQLHSDLPATLLRGYRQVNTGDTTVSQFHYLGPLIVADRNTPVRIKFINDLPTGTGGDLFLPVDTTVMGAGMGPYEMTPPTGDMNYAQNRATLHLHGAFVPWISDGTPHQWTTPAGEDTAYPKGVSVYNVPDMPDGGPNPPQGTLTFYYNNQQSARLMFYHDHSYGITRLNVYAGEAAGYLLTDQVEKDMINGTNVSGINPDLAKVLPDEGIPLIIQDKTFIDAATVAAQDPTWKWGSMPGMPMTGDLWYPHVYVPAQNPYDPTGANPFGRWHYAPWFWPPAKNLTYGPIPNPYYDPINAPWEPPEMPATPNPSMPGEAFMDTLVVNGTLYPYMEVEPKAYRFRILNAADDRFFNLQLYKADSAVVTSDGRSDTEVRMVPATNTVGFPPTWPTDGRDGGTPDPGSVGPSFIQIGTEGGFLPAPVEVLNQPVTWNLNPTTFNFGNVKDHALLLGTAERADVVIDFSAFAGQTLILYNDAPAAFPALDSRYDYYTGNPDQTDSGGTPSTQSGYGPNTRTIMQIRVGPTVTTPSNFDLTKLKSVFAKTASKRGVFEVSQDQIIVPQAAYNSAYDASFPTDAFVRIQDNYMSFFNGPLTGYTINNSGSGYTSVPTVTITGGGGTGASATSSLGVVSLTKASSGSGYTSVPTVAITGGGGTGATGIATLTPTSVARITVTDGGSGYRTTPTVSITGGGGAGATAMATLQGNKVGSVTITNGGSGYTSTPSVSFTGGGGTGAVANAVLSTTSVASFTVTNKGSGYTSVPIVTVSGGGGSGAAATASLGVVDITLVSGGSGYTSSPTVTITGGSGTGAAAVANGQKIYLQPKAVQDEMGEAYDIDYGRMSGMLGLELPQTVAGAQNFMLYGYASPPVELLEPSVYGTPIGSTGDGTQFWKITHNGVDTHTIHTHLFNVQLINRVSWDGAIMPPDPNELGWKETFRLNPLEDTIVAMRPILPTQPFEIPNSIRPIDPTMPLGAVLKGGPGGFADPSGEPITVINHIVNYGWEYVYHCHLLAHEEMDMMHAVIIGVAPKTPTNFVATRTGTGSNQRVVLSWQDNSVTETSFTVQRAVGTGPWTTIATLLSATGPGTGSTITYTNSPLARRTTYSYRVLANNVVGDTTVYPAPAIGFPNTSVNSGPTSPISIITN